MHPSNPTPHLRVHCSLDSCTIRSFSVCVPPGLDVTTDNNTRQTAAYLISLPARPKFFAPRPNRPSRIVSFSSLWPLVLCFALPQLMVLVVWLLLCLTVGDSAASDVND